MVSTISSAGCLAASMARRTSSMREVAPVEVSLCTTHTALMVCPLSSRRRASMALASAPLRQSDSMNSGCRPSLTRHVAPQRGEVAGLVHQHLVAGRQRVDERRLPRAGAGGRIDEHRIGGLEDGLDAGQHALAELLELRPAMVDHRHGHRLQDAVGHRRRPRNLQEVPAGAARLVRHQVVSVARGAYLKAGLWRAANARRDAIGFLELAGHVALVGEAAGDRSLGQRCTGSQQVSGTIEAPHHLVAVGAGAEARAKMSRQGEAVEAGDGLESARTATMLLDVGVEEVARQRHRPQARRLPVVGWRLERSSATSAAATSAMIWSSCRSSSGASRSCSAGRMAAISRVSSVTPAVGERAAAAACRRARAWIEARLDVGDAVAKAAVGAGAPVVHLVGMHGDGPAAAGCARSRRGSRTAARRTASRRSHRCRAGADRSRGRRNRLPAARCRAAAAPA